MAEGTPGRGSINTTAPPRREPRALGVLPFVRAASRRALPLAIAIAMLLHLPFLPTPLLAWISAALSLGGAELSDYDAGETIIPIDLDIMASDPNAIDQAPTAAPTGAPPEPVATREGGGVGPDAGAPPDAGREPSSRDAGALPSVRAASGDADAGPAEDDGQPKLRDPLSVAGAPGKLASKDPNVQVLIAGDRLRKHELGEWFGRILTSLPQWQSFFSDTGIDPIRDIDHLLIAGPQFRDSSKVVAVLDYRAPEAAMREAVDVLVKRSGGSWIEGAAVPAARARADRSERIFALVPDKRLLVVLPADQEDQLSKLKSMRPFSRSAAAGVVISMLTPANAFRGVYALSPSLAWARLALTPVKDGSADLAITLGDASPADAAIHAQELTSTLNAMRSIDLGITKIDVLDEVTFNADGKVIWAKIHVTSKQLKLIMGFVEQTMRDRSGARPQKAP